MEKQTKSSKIKKMKLEGLTILALIVALCALVAPVAAQPTPFMIYGYVFYENGDECNNPTVNINNTNTNNNWSTEIKTNASYNYYQLMLANGTDVNASEILRFNVTSPTGNQSNITNYTVTPNDIKKGGFFNFNISLEALISCEPAIEVNKTVWNGTAWVEMIPDAEINNTYRFRCEVHNNGTGTGCDLTEIKVVDNLSDRLEYAYNATPREPDWTAGKKFGWNFTGPLAPCETIVIEFDAKVIGCGNDSNVQNATAYCPKTEEWVSDGDDAWINVPDGTICGYGTWEPDPDNMCQDRREILRCVDGTCTAATPPEFEYRPANETAICDYGAWEPDPDNMCQDRREILRCVDETCTAATPPEFEYRPANETAICGYGNWTDYPEDPCEERREIHRCVSGNCTPSGEYEYRNKIIPDLVITEKHETLVGGNFTVTYTVTNVGGGDAGASNTTIYIDGVNSLEDPVPPLASGDNYTNTVGPFQCPCGTTLNVTVCADNNNTVAECNETNNCKVNIVTCPEAHTKVTTYDFSDLTSAGVNKWAYRYQIYPLKPPTTNDTPDVEFVGTDRKGEYTMISKDDHKMQKDSSDSSGNYTAHRFVFNISESVESIVEIDVQWIGKGVTRDKAQEHGATLYIWNATSSEYEELDWTNRRQRKTLSGNITVHAENYIDTAGILTILVVQNANQTETLKERALVSMLSTDYVRADIILS